MKILLTEKEKESWIKDFLLAEVQQKFAREAFGRFGLDPYKNGHINFLGKAIYLTGIDEEKLSFLESDTIGINFDRLTRDLAQNHIESPERAIKIFTAYLKNVLVAKGLGGQTDFIKLNYEV